MRINMEAPTSNESYVEICFKRLSKGLVKTWKHVIIIVENVNEITASPLNARIKVCGH